jgi:glycosyltransferase involved in cell wall biosynthesis
MNNYKQRKEIIPDVSLVLSNNIYIKDFFGFFPRNFIDGKNFKGKERLMYSVNKSISRARLSRNNYDIFHPTYYDPYFLKYLGNKPFVLTVYDMIHELYPDQFTNTHSVIERKRKCITSATKIICISENTKKDLLRMYDVPPEKVKVVYLSSSLSPSHEIDMSVLKKNYDINRPYILYVGNRDGYKNFALLLDVFNSDFRNDYDLICFGGKKFSTKEESMIKELGIQKEVKYVTGDDNLLYTLYKNAFCFVYPSLYEGFGIPPLEAMAAGCPVIASNSSSIPEVVGEAGLLFDPKSKESLTSSIYRLIHDENERSRLIQKGLLRTSKFSWDNTAKQTYDIYIELTNEN